MKQVFLKLMFLTLAIGAICLFGSPHTNACDRKIEIRECIIQTPVKAAPAAAPVPGTETEAYTDFIRTSSLLRI